MSEAAAPEEGQEISVLPEEIERALKKIRAERDQSGKTDPSFKPSVILSNFIVTVCAPLASVRVELEKLLEELAILVPSRFFIVSLADTDISKLDTAVVSRISKVLQDRIFTQKKYL